ncbi:MAG: DUF1761 domain-containing protein [Bacteroidetes bacterium]|nr:DUF1761 domain-containing protein [Bacteroidota bacterium]MBK8487626.1 DUF1761 domain-containing protein [Bacteroidota bacterium]
MDYSNINYLAVIVCTVIAFVLGALWYSPVLFSKTWQKEVGLTNDDLKNANMFQIFGSSFVLMLVMIIGLAVLLGMTAHSTSFMSGFTFGLWIGVFFNAASYGINMLYQRKSLKLWLIDSSYQILFLAISGGILSIWK